VGLRTSPLNEFCSRTREPLLTSRRPWRWCYHRLRQRGRASSRASVRQREVAARGARGRARRIFRQLLTESMLPHRRRRARARVAVPASADEHDSRRPATADGDWFERTCLRLLADYTCHRTRGLVRVIRGSRQDPIGSLSENPDAPRPGRGDARAPVLQLALAFVLPNSSDHPEQPGASRPARPHSIRPASLSRLRRSGTSLCASAHIRASRNFRDLRSPIAEASASARTPARDTGHRGRRHLLTAVDSFAPRPWRSRRMASTTRVARGVQGPRHANNDSQVLSSRRTCLRRASPDRSRS
jgi:hypothetical protein